VSFTALRELGATYRFRTEVFGRGYQEESEAAGKWRRAQLTSVQLSTYYVGYTEVADLARELLANAWSDPTFVSSYARWTIDILDEQRHYHYRIASKHHALRHRVHIVNSALFGLTAVGAVLHLAIHKLLLSLITCFFPALGASLHGALAQSESYRLGTTSERLVSELQGAMASIRTALDEAVAMGDVTALKAAIEAAIALILEEHQDWHLLVRPHNLPLA